MKKLTYTLLLAFSIFILFSSAYSQNTNGALKLSITGIKNTNGAIIVLLFNKKDGFPVDISKSYRNITGKIINGKCNVEFSKLPFGQYAICCFHDENNNKELDKAWYGKPKEGMGFSNNVKGSSSGAPSFEKAKFDFNQQTDILTININYF
jgi:uncharacterized protein (DUF2141 family)